jgi:hypothetical protein
MIKDHAMTNLYWEMLKEENLKIKKLMNIGKIRQIIKKVHIQIAMK